MVRRGTRTTRGADGRFFGRRVNCEQVPLLPAWVVADVLDDPRKTPYVLVWQSSDQTVWEKVHVAPHGDDRAVEIRRQDGTSNFIRATSRPLPRNGGRACFLICPSCQVPRRGLYGWEPGGRFTSSTVQSNWRCRACNKLRYASEGCRSGRPDSWYPEVFASPEEARQADL